MHKYSIFSHLQARTSAVLITRMTSLSSKLSVQSRHSEGEQPVIATLYNSIGATLLDESRRMRYFITIFPQETE